MLNDFIMLRTGKVPLRTVWSMAHACIRNKALHLPAAGIGCWWLISESSSASHSLPKLCQGISPLRNGQKQGTKTAPCLYSRLTLSGNSRSKPHGGCLWPPLQCVHKSTSPSASIFPVQMLFPVIIHQSPIGVSFPGNSFRQLTLKLSPRNKMLKWSFWNSPLAQCLRVHLTEQGTQVQNHMPQSSLRPHTTDTLETKYCNYRTPLLQLMKPGTL